ncbi:hypothetical protein ABXR57_001607 [Escherichia coli]|uniref:hypothetical protein n=1 Tax=Escherichia coli TaxID=562 RepID=UPI00063D46A5|nr:hypothetical protein [Escherichia coli]EFE8618188.1 hypothetical protein [Escherichia coli O103]EES1766909.1 hypothetical protein [Escherichia coli]EET4453156.1 hypothetical protein [Escherichia coli]EEW6535738.1 hypothetical protein [Escherichia coli]EFB3700525.1 hypothetical protein [Escherichia coli]
MESNIKELVAAGHEMDSELKAECGAVDMRSVAKLLSDLATQLEVQLARANALAAENAGLKSGAMDEIKVINRGGQAYCVKDGVQVNPMYARGWNDYRAKSLQSDTPATDAFLAEVRAQGVEMYADNLDNGADDAERGGFDDAVKFLRSEASGVRLFADQLRKGGNQ